MVWLRLVKRDLQMQLKQKTPTSATRLDSPSHSFGYCTLLSVKGASVLQVESYLETRSGSCELHRLQIRSALSGIRSGVVM
jgi:hypothetical protein